MAGGVERPQGDVAEPDLAPVPQALVGKRVGPVRPALATQAERRAGALGEFKGAAQVVRVDVRLRYADDPHPVFLGKPQVNPDVAPGVHHDRLSGPGPQRQRVALADVAHHQHPPLRRPPG